MRLKDLLGPVARFKRKKKKTGLSVRNPYLQKWGTLVGLDPPHSNALPPLQVLSDVGNEKQRHLAHKKQPAP